MLWRILGHAQSRTSTTYPPLWGIAAAMLRAEYARRAEMGANFVAALALRAC